ncbi:trans-1,2-dihydrobenzene-1,2-diol dehydrogenase-like [Arctopsyche grandis]|uniref:trans-1,2-dihydrobenzene-1,2-diol dehydrogenase-like n=1 Tax=Arctopsyche grandis TaxID=121162 RepID=UPI00406D8CF6
MALSWGIVDVGPISHDFVTALATLPKKEHKIVSVVAKNVKQTEAFAILHDIKTSYSEYESLATDENVEIVYIGAPNLHHYKLTKLMLENGKHVLCEKPLCTSYEDSKKLISLAQSKNLFLMEGIWSRFFPVYEALDQHIQTNSLGDVLVVNVQFGVQISEDERVLMKEFGGGAILDLGIYALQFAQLIYKDDPIKISCTGHLGICGIDESMSCILRYSNGRIATITTHSKVLLPNEAIIIGTKGSLKLSTFWAPTILQTSAANITEWQLPHARHRFNFHNSAGLTYEAQECRRCIRAGLIESSKLTHNETLSIAKIADELQRQMSIPINNAID